MSVIKVYKNNIDDGIRKFKNESSKNKTTSLVRDKEHYTKPGVKKRLAKKEAVANARKKAKKATRD